MTYSAGIGPRLAASLGIPGPSEPTLYCDTPGCTVSQTIGFTTKTWMRSLTLRGWETQRTEHDDGRVSRVDYCPACKRARAET
jgi:hypothetical protein